MAWKGGMKGGWGPAGGAAAAASWAEEEAVKGAVATGSVMWVAVGDNALTQQGFPPEGAALVYEKGPNIFSSAAFVLGDAVGDIASEVEIVHDADWEQYPDIGEAVKAA